MGRTQRRPHDWLTAQVGIEGGPERVRCARFGGEGWDDGEYVEVAEDTLPGAQ